MALHILQNKQNNQMPWQWQLASQMLVPMISGAIERQRQRDENRKNNALLAKTMNDILGQTPTPMPQGASGGYGGNDWENAFHSSQNNPMAQFDAGTADLMPPSMQGVQAAIPQQKAVGSSDFLRALAANMGTERFGMVDPKYIQELATPYIANLEAAKAEARRANAADAFRNAEGAYGRASSMLESTIRGDLPESYVNTAGNFYKATMPQPMMQDLGGSLQGIIYDPTTGTFTNAQSWPKTLTPQQVEDNRYRNDVFDYTKQKDARDFEAQRTDADRKYELEKRPAFVKTERGDDGRVYKIYNDGSQELVTPDAVGFSAAEIGKMSILENQRKELIAQQTSLMKDLAKTQTDEERASLTSSLTSINTKIKGIDDEISSMYDKKLSNKRAATTTLGTGEDIGINMLGGNGSIFSHYNTPRKRKDGTPYNHAGTDYAAKEGTEILLPDVGTPLRVVRVANDATGYGNYVDLKGTLKGHDIELRIAHMKDGSVNIRNGDLLKTGDLIGLVGNTGNSRGPNGGYHMHLEVKINGKSVDPTTAWGIINSYIPKQEQPAGNAQPAQGNEQPTQGPSAGNGQPVTQAQPAHNEITAAMNNPALNWTPSYQRVNMPDAYTVANAPIPQHPATPTQNQTVASFNTPAAYAAEPPNNTVSSDVSAPVVSNDVQLTPPFSYDIPVNSGNATLPIAAPPTTSDDIAAVLREANQGAPQYDLSNADLTASLPGSGAAPKPARRIDPDGGLGEYRAEGDNTPVTWRNKSGNPMRTSDGQLFTQGIYDDWKRKADAGHFKDVGINNAEDLNKWLEKIGMRPDRPSEQRGVNNLNGNTRANDNLPSEGEDENITPFNITPSNSPEKFQAPEFTDEINGTTPDATQDLLDGLNGITNSRYRGWTETLKRITPSGGNFRNLPYTMEDRMNSMIDGIGRYIRYGDRYGLRGEQDLLLRPEDNRNSFTLANDTSSRLPNYTPLLNDTISRLGYGQPPANPYQQPNYPLDTRANDPYVGDVSATRPPIAIPSRTGTSPTVPQQATPQRPAVQRQVSQRPSSKPRAGYTNYEQQRTHVDGAAKRHGVDSALIRAIIETESSWKPNARSKVGAMGLMQLMPKTAKWLGVRNAYDPAQNIEGGSKYIAQLIRQFGGNVSKALMAYNCGPGNVKKGRIPAESRRYAQKVLGIYRRLKGQ